VAILVKKTKLLNFTWHLVNEEGDLCTASSRYNELLRHYNNMNPIRLREDYDLWSYERMITTRLRVAFKLRTITCSRTENNQLILKCILFGVWL